MTRLATPIYDNAHPKHFWSAFNFCDHVSTYKNSGYLLHLFILKIQPILESHHQSGQTHFWTCLFFTMTTPILCEIVPACKKINYFDQFFLEIQSILESRDQIGYNHFWPCPPITFQSIFNFCEFISTYKKWGCFIDLLWRNAWFKTPTIWMIGRILAYISETKFFQDLYRNTVNNINFHYKTSPEKINDQIFLWIQKTLLWPYSWPTSPILGSKKCFHKKSGMHNLIRFSITMPKFRETQWSNSKKTTQETTGWKDGQTLFHGTLPGTTRGLTNITAVDWHLKVKDIEYDVGLTKNYCLTVSMQKISWIHELIL